ncbi:MAG: phosphatase PAP2 family protein [Crocinitomicaceae bacterium]|nr:MAG: phosphatase PAP2 family protein [Crocinitomicaceae bacterium]
MKQLSHLLSWIFLPLFMPLFGLLIAMYVPSSPQSLVDNDSLFLMIDQNKWVVLFMFFVFSTVAPGLSFVILRALNVITTIDMESKRERLIPMLIMLAYCLLLYFLFLVKAHNNILPKYVYALPLAGVFVTASFTLINRWIKISLHAGGAGILSGFIFAYSMEQAEFQFWTILVVILASGLTIMARLFLRKHTPTEVYSGWSLAVLITFLINFYYPIG